MIRFAPEVEEALHEGAAVVALETTLIAHGFPPGAGVEVGLASERAVRDGGAVPATVGVLDGNVVVGLRTDELERFDAARRKVGPRDLAAALIGGLIGATTVGGTLAVCRRPGSDSSRRAVSAACIEAGRRRRMSLPTSVRSRLRASSSSPRG